MGLRGIVVAAIAAVYCLSYVPQEAHAAPIIWDYGPTTGTDGGAWQNLNTGQNFAEQIHFPSAASLTGYEHFAFVFPPDPGDVYRLKLLADASGLPGALLGTWDLSPTSSALVAGTDYYQMSFVLPGIPLAGGTNYWIGLSGKGFTAAQRSVNAPGDGAMAQFSGSTYSFSAKLGDQMFELEGFVPEPVGAPVATMALLAGWMRRKARQRT